jgi:hypothetical protein
VPSTSDHSFILADLTGIVVAFLLFSSLTFLPGYTLGWLLNVLRFRQREMFFRFAISVPLSIALGPLIDYFIGRWLSLAIACVFFAALSAAAIPLILIHRPAFRGKIKLTWLWVGIAWCASAILALSDMQIGRQLYFSIIAFDYAVRTAFVASISTFGLPARNPFFYPGQPVALRYHYFWLIPSALVHKLAAPLVDARQAFIAGTMWCGIGLLAMIVLYLRFFKIRRTSSLKLGILAAFGFLLVTGLDILPALFFLLLAKCHLIGTLPPSMEWWNDQVDGWLYSMLWEPHYVSGLIAVLFGFLVISYPGKRKFSSGVIAGLAFAMSVGAAIYVALVFAIFLSCWGGVTLFRRWYAELTVLIVAGVTAVLCSLPFLAGLRGPGSGGAFLHWTVRSFFVVDVIAQLLHVQHSWQKYLANLLLLPLNYFLELGLFFVVGILEWRRVLRMETILRNDLAMGMMALVSIGVCTFLRSGLITNNDLGWRGFLIAQFVLLIRAAQLLTAETTLRSKRVAALAILGFLGTMYDQALLRFYPLLSDYKVLPKVAWLARDEKLGQRTYANREAYAWLRTHSTARSLIQQNPKQEIQDTFYGLYADRGTLAEDVECATTFGGDPKACIPLQRMLLPLFAGDASSESLGAACAALPEMDFIVAKDTDAVWGREESWVWKRAPLFANSFVRVFRCR